MFTNQSNITESEQENTLTRVGHSLRERVKELNCLYGLSELIERHGNDLPAILTRLTELLRVSWQYPEAACARIEFKGQVFLSANFMDASAVEPQVQSAIITQGDSQVVGVVEVFYMQELPDADEGPFLREERQLIEAVAERIGRTSERIDIRRELQTQRETLVMKNAALSELLSQIKQQRDEQSSNIRQNIQRSLLPILNILETDATPRQRQYLSLLRESLLDITSPVIGSLAVNTHSLSPTEVLICSMIASGMSSKEIASARGVSTSTVARHREHIREKLNLTNNKINLVTFLQTLKDNS